MPARDLGGPVNLMTRERNRRPPVRRFGASCPAKASPATPGPSWLVMLALATCGLHATAASSKPIGPTLFCENYPDAPGCAGRVVNCTQCHEKTPPWLNPYGMVLRANLWADPSYPLEEDGYERCLPNALAMVSQEDSDEDGVPNVEEIAAGTGPGDAASVYLGEAPPTGTPNADFDVGNYDPRFAFRRIMVTYCGMSPSYEDMAALAAASNKAAVLHAKLDECLASDYWRREALHRLGDSKIRPEKATGLHGDFILADYFWDYRLFSFVLSGSRDVRDLLMATYHIGESDQVVEGVIAQVPYSMVGTAMRMGSGQPLAKEHRAGMITTQWFLVMNTMYSRLPRSTAAQAYRAYLGADISENEGMQPVAGEPRDVDQNGVSEPACAACHSTLDPLAYAFSTYNGINPDPLSNASGQYDPERTVWGGDGTLFGEPVSDLLDWANVAVNSDDFLRSLGEMFYRQALGHKPVPRDLVDLITNWKALPEDGYRAEKFIHRLVDSDAFGVP